MAVTHLSLSTDPERLAGGGLAGSVRLQEAEHVVDHLGVVDGLQLAPLGLGEHHPDGVPAALLLQLLLLLPPLQLLQTLLTSRRAGGDVRARRVEEITGESSAKCWQTQDG